MKAEKLSSESGALATLPCALDPFIDATDRVAWIPAGARTAAGACTAAGARTAAWAFTASVAPAGRGSG
jgi:hypothetical protein